MSGCAFFGLFLCVLCVFSGYFADCLCYALKNLLLIDSLCSPFGLPAAVFLRFASILLILSSCLNNRFYSAGRVQVLKVESLAFLMKKPWPAGISALGTARRPSIQLVPLW